MSRSRFGAINYGSSKMALAPLEEPLKKSRAKHPLNMGARIFLNGVVPSLISDVPINIEVPVVSGQFF